MGGTSYGGWTEVRWGEIGKLSGTNLGYLSLAYKMWKRDILEYDTNVFQISFSLFIFVINSYQCSSKLLLD